MSPKAQRVLVGIGLTVGGAAVGNRVDSLLHGGSVLPNVVWLAVSGLLFVPLFSSLAREAKDKPGPAASQ